MKISAKPGALRLAAVAAAVALPLSVHATNGYLAHGYGIKSLGIAGIGIALPQDALAAAANPAGTAFVGDRMDLGVTYFKPTRSADIVGNDFGADAHYDANDTKSFVIPDFGYTRKINSTTHVGVAVYGNGGMNTDYGVNPYSRFGATGSAGVDMAQLFISPNVAFKLNDTHTIGAAVNFAYQRFKMKGVGLFSGFSASPGNVSDQGRDHSTGTGVRLGWLGKVSPQLTLGATWSSKISGRFDKYKGLFADQGRFDIPENYGFGMAYEASDKWTFAADVQRILYNRVSSVGNSVDSLFAGQPLGSANGPGFGWRNATVIKLGVSHRLRQDLTLRAGISTVNQAVPSGETFFNILAPGMIRHHLTLGGTWTLANGNEVSGYFAHGFGTTVNGSNSIPPGFPPAGLGGGNANVRLKETMLGVSYGWKF